MLDSMNQFEKELNVSNFISFSKKRKKIKTSYFSPLCDESQENLRLIMMSHRSKHFILYLCYQSYYSRCNALRFLSGDYVSQKADGEALFLDTIIDLQIIK